MKKKIVLTLIAVVAVAAGVMGIGAFEAHIINVTAHIENALSVPNEIKFGTVFPQEYVEQPLTIALSDSFLASDRLDDVSYVINQKLKPCPVNVDRKPVDSTCVKDDANNTPENPTGWHYLSLCPFLSKLPATETGDVGEASYYNPKTNTCSGPVDHIVPGGYLSKAGNDLSDNWTIDLKVPPITGTVGQDWPASCSNFVVPTNSTTYGCDLWVEVTGLSTVEQYPKTGTAYIGYEDWTSGDLDYNDFGMDFSAKEYYNKISGTDYLTKNVMTFKAVIYDSGADHYIHINRPYVGNYTYTVTRSGSAYTDEVAAGTYSGSGNLDLVLFNTVKYSWPQININETVTVEVTLDNPLANPKVALPAPRPDLDPFMANYDPWENPYQGVVGTFHIAHIETIASIANQKNTPTFVPVGTDVPFILVIPVTSWRPPHEDTTITSPYPDFIKFYDGAVGVWNFGFQTWYLNLVNSTVGLGGVAF